MNLFGGVVPINGITFLVFCVFSILAIGYALGRITIKGISLGDAGVFIIALLVGALLFSVNDAGQLIFAGSSKPYDFNTGLSILESFGLSPDKKTVLFFGGGEFGLGKTQTFKIFKSFVECHENIQIVAIAGKNHWSLSPQ